MSARFVVAEPEELGMVGILTLLSVDSIYIDIYEYNLNMHVYLLASDINLR